MLKHGYGNFIFDDYVAYNGLRICAQYNGKNVYNTHNIDNYKILKHVINKYKNEKSLFERAIIDRFSELIKRWRSQNAKVAIYGAGVHTLFLLNLLEVHDLVVAIIDSDPRKQGNKYLNWEISDESVLSEGFINVVIVSSKAFQEEIYLRLLEYRESGIELVKCYI